MRWTSRSRNSASARVGPCGVSSTFASGAAERRITDDPPPPVPDADGAGADGIGAAARVVAVPTPGFAGGVTTPPPLAAARRVRSSSAVGADPLDSAGGWVERDGAGRGGVDDETGAPPTRSPSVPGRRAVDDDPADGATRRRSASTWSRPVVGRRSDSGAVASLDVDRERSGTEGAVDRARVPTIGERRIIDPGADATGGAGIADATGVEMVAAGTGLAADIAAAGAAGAAGCWRTGARPTDAARWAGSVSCVRCVGCGRSTGAGIAGVRRVAGVDAVRDSGVTRALRPLEVGPDAGPIGAVVIEAETGPATGAPLGRRPNGCGREAVLPGRVVAAAASTGTRSDGARRGCSWGCGFGEGTGARVDRADGEGETGAGSEACSRRATGAAETAGTSESVAGTAKATGRTAPDEVTVIGPPSVCGDAGRAASDGEVHIRRTRSPGLDADRGARDMGRRRMMAAGDAAGAIGGADTAAVNGDGPARSDGLAGAGPGSAEIGRSGWAGAPGALSCENGAADGEGRGLGTVGLVGLDGDVAGIRPRGRPGPRVVSADAGPFGQSCSRAGAAGRGVRSPRATSAAGVGAGAPPKRREAWPGAVSEPAWVWPCRRIAIGRPRLGGAALGRAPAWDRRIRSRSSSVPGGRANSVCIQNSGGAVAIESIVPATGAPSAARRLSGTPIDREKARALRMTRPTVERPMDRTPIRGRTRPAISAPSSASSADGALVGSDIDAQVRRFEAAVRDLQLFFGHLGARRREARS